MLSMAKMKTVTLMITISSSEQPVKFNSEEQLKYSLSELVSVWRRMFVRGKNGQKYQAEHTTKEEAKSD